VSRLTMWQSLRCVRLVLWDEGCRRLISFRELRRSDASALRRRSRAAVS
jgi:acyl-lipid omega-6 desaturase (Delta-12 desaturase)